MRRRILASGRAVVDAAPLPRLLLFVAGANCAVVFCLLIAYGRPGLGIGQGFYLSVVLAALVTGPIGGAVAGALAVILYATALVLGGELAWGDVLSEADGIRLASYIAAGTAVGYVAKRGRELLAEALGSLESLLALAGRDLTTAALAGDGLRRAIDRRLAHSEPFALVIVDVVASEAPDQKTARRISALIRGAFGSDEELARIGPGRFAVVTAAPLDQAVSACVSIFAGAGLEASVGWGAYPADGANAFSVFSTALDRLHGARALGPPRVLASS